MRSAQQLYEISVKHLRKQKQKSFRMLPPDEKLGEMYQSRYRSNDGMMCAIGVLIPDIEYRPEMEGKDVSDLLKDNLLILMRAAEFHKHRRLLDGLQKIHDTKPIAEWEKHWRMLADDMLLKYPKQ
jgi:hypothetical protein